MSEFDEYIRQGEPGRSEKAAAWQTAIGLQDVDGLKPSKYLIETAKKHIEGDITIDDVKSMLNSYYSSKGARDEIEHVRTEEADKVSARITELLEEETFAFIPGELARIHRRLFHGLFKFAGAYRTYNISKKEWVLNDASVLYNPFENIAETLEYDFSEERKYDYISASTDDAVRHIALFIAGVWQIHPFGEGNTRTTAVFLIKYLRSFGFHIDNELFASHSWYFRNALVRANYYNREKGIDSDDSFLIAFLRNLILGEHNELRNRYLHVDYPKSDSSQSADPDDSKSKSCTLNCTLEELAVLKYLSDNPKATQKQVASHIRKSERTAKTLTVKLQQAGLLERKNGRRDGYWKVKVQL